MPRGIADGRRHSLSARPFDARRRATPARRSRTRTLVEGHVSQREVSLGLGGLVSDYHLRSPSFDALDASPVCAVNDGFRARPRSSACGEFCLLRRTSIRRRQRRVRSIAVVEAAKPSLAKNSAAPCLPARSTQVMFGSDPTRLSTSARPMPRRRNGSATMTMDKYPLEIPSVIARAKPTISSPDTAITARCDAEISRPSCSTSPTRWAHPLDRSSR